MNEIGLFIFRRDFRINDNTTLNKMIAKCKYIYPIFIFTPEQVTDKNTYKSNAAVKFMIESLQELASHIKEKNGELYSFYGDNTKIIKYLIKSLNITLVGFNMDYSPYAVQRDEEIKHLCQSLNVDIMMEHDYYLQPPGTIVNSTGTPYQKFTPFYEKVVKMRIDSPSSSSSSSSVNTNKFNFKRKNEIEDYPNQMSLKLALYKFTSKEPSSDADDAADSHDEMLGGRDIALKKLNAAVALQKHYTQSHNDLSKPTSELSAYIKFGCISIREVYKKFKGNKDFIRQLIWRDFYAHILYAFPKVLGHALKPAYDKIKWTNNIQAINAWKKGMTGVPIVDAGMRQLNQTGYMHNRARLIVASFLVKTLLVDWRIGEEYFASKLRDYDPASNNGNWQWIAGSGADSQPYFRIFNPWEQAKNHDPNCHYIAEWVPELRDLPNKVILNWDKEYKNYLSHTNNNNNNNNAHSIKYYPPIVDYTTQKEKVLAKYKSIFT